MMSGRLPWDLVEEILCRVPAISLKRLRSTCKRWNRLFNDKEFARKHFHKAAKQSLVFTVTKRFTTCLMSVNLHGTPSVEFKGEPSVLDYSNQLRISQVFHCDGLLLCTFYYDTRIVLWNPCTGKTRWIQPINIYHTYALGSYQESRSGKNSYKILSYSALIHHDFAIYEINSNSWRVLDVIPDFYLMYVGTCVSLKGKTYWFASDRDREDDGLFLVSFDYTTERFGRLSLPCECPLGCLQDEALSVSEEKLSVLLLHKNTWRTEIWVSNKIDDGDKEVSWRKFLTVDYTKRDIWFTCFLIDEEKKVVLCCEKCIFEHNPTELNELVYIAGENNKVTLMDFGPVTFGSVWPIILDYVPSLVQIPPGGGKRKYRGD